MRVKPEGLLNLRNYYRAVNATIILSWKHRVNQKVWVKLKKMMEGRNLTHALWVPHLYWGLSDTTSFLTNHTLGLWLISGEPYPRQSPPPPAGWLPFIPPQVNPCLSAGHNWLMKTLNVSNSWRVVICAHWRYSERCVVGSLWMPGDTSSYNILSPLT